MATAELGLQTGDLPSQSVPETHGAQIPDSLLRPKNPIIDPISGLTPTDLVSLRVAAMSDAELDAAIGPVVNETSPAQPALKTEKARKEMLSGWKKRLAFAGGAVGFAGTMFATPTLAGGDRFIAEPGAGETGKSATEIYCTPEYIAQYPQLLAGGDSNVGGEATSQTQTNIAEAAGSDTPLAIQQPETGEQRVIVNFTDQDGRALSVLLPVCPPEGEQTGNPEVIKDELQQRLDAWNSGEFRTDLKLDEFFTDRRGYYPLNIMSTYLLENQEDLDRAGILFQGVLLGCEVVKDADGLERLIVYFGQEGFQRERYFIGVNFGRYTNENVSPGFGKVPQDTPTATPDKYISTQKLEESVTGTEGSVYMFKLTAAKFARTVDPTLKDRAIDGIDQHDIALKYLFEARDMLEDEIKLENLPDTSVAKEFVINKRITKFVPGEVLLSTGMYSAKES